MESDFKNLLNTFPGMTLIQMEKLSLQNRTDTKYILPEHYLPEILKILAPDYHILDVEGMRQNRYETHYLDTPELRFYHEHLHGKLNRYKIRFRKYPDNQLCFLEIKFKNNKGRTLKTRIRTNQETDTLCGPEAAYLEANTPFRASELVYQTSVYFNRVTLISRTSEERLTFDTGLEFRNTTQTYQAKGLLVAELKQEKPVKSEFSMLMKKRNTPESALSKYCYAMLCLNPALKNNTFKPVLLQINRL
ncbi:MAG TPA: polyphosphate polymerase domain-containing protein [Bacteroidia bacterium]|nr:polyphosphate polymerase domain-containing protein [Bacteroidia bacterium]